MEQTLLPCVTDAEAPEPGKTEPRTEGGSAEGGEESGSYCPARGSFSTRVRTQEPGVERGYGKGGDFRPQEPVPSVIIILRAPSLFLSLYTSLKT